MNNNPKHNLAALAIVQSLILFSLAACAGQSQPEGWSGAVVDTDSVYVGTMEGDVRALNLKTGETRWIFPLRGEVEANRATYGTPALNGTTLYVGGYDGHLYSIDTKTGGDLWDILVGAGSPIVGGPAVQGTTVVVASSDGNIYAYETTNGTLIWRFPTDNKVWATPTIVDDHVYVGSLDQKMYALNLNDGTKLWEYSAGGGITSQALIDDGRLYFGSFDSTFVALDAVNGKPLWTFDGARSWYWAAPIKFGESIYASSMDGNIYMLDARQGQLKWAFNTESSIVGTPAIVGDALAVPSLDGRVWLIDLSNGVERGRCNIGERLRAPISSQDMFIYFRAANNTVRSLEIKTNGFPDEQWVHYTNDLEDPLKRRKSIQPAC